MRGLNILTKCQEPRRSILECVFLYLDKNEMPMVALHDESNGLHYTLVGYYYIPDLKLPEEKRHTGHYRRLHRDYLKQEHPARYSSLILTGKLWTYLADLNEQVEEIIRNAHIRSFGCIFYDRNYRYMTLSIMLPNA